MISKKSKVFTLIDIGIICFFLGITMTTLPSLSNLLIKKSLYNIDENKYAILTFIMVFSAIIFSNVAGFLGKKWDLKKVIITGILFCFSGLLLYSFSYYFSNNIYTLLRLGQICLGLGLSFILTSLTAYLCLLFPKISAITLTGIFACINLGSISGPIFFNFLLRNAWGINCFVVGLFWLLLFLSSLKILPVIKNKYTQESKHKLLFTKRFLLFWIFLIILILYSICEYSYAYWGIIYLNKIKAFSPSLSRYALSFFWAAVGVGQITIFFLLNYIKPRVFYRILPIFIASGFGILFFSNSYNLNILGFIIGGLGSSAFVALSLSFVEKTFKEVAEITAGIMFSGYFLGYILASLSIGESIKYFSLSYIFVAMGMIAVIMELIALFLMKKTKNSYSSNSSS